MLNARDFRYIVVSMKIIQHCEYCPDHSIVTRRSSVHGSQAYILR